MKIESIPRYLLQLDHCLKLLDYTDKKILYKQITFRKSISIQY